MIGAPKTVAGERTVSLDDGSVEVLKRWQERQSKEREGCGDGWQDTGLVFTREDGSPLQPESVSTAFGRIAEEAGLPPIRLHDVRHTAASLAS